ncbi:MAG: DUF4363 family protein [Christensenellales bacterium]
MSGIKKIVLVAVIFALIVAGGITEQIYIDKTFDKLENYADKIYFLLQEERYTEALTLTADLSDWWAKERDKLEFLCSNVDIKEIYREIGELQGSQYAEMYDDSITRANVLKYMAKNSKNLLAFKIKNIL